MGEEIHHYCGVAMVRLLKPMEYYIDKYKTPFYGLNKLYLLLEKQRNRGQDGAGIACVKMDVDPGYRFVDCQKSSEKDPISDVMEKCKMEAEQKLKEIPSDLRSNSRVLKHKVPYTGEVFLGHVRYGTDSDNDIEKCHPICKISNWLTRSLVLAGNFNITNLDELFAELILVGQHPREKSDTVTLTENLSCLLDQENKELYAKYFAQGYDMKTCFQLIAENLNIYKILRHASVRWDGGYCICGMLGHGDSFAMRDPSGIRPGYYYISDEVCVVASERPVIQSVFQASTNEVHELLPGNALVVKLDGSIFVEAVVPPSITAKCSFERIYFSRGGDGSIYKERLKLGKLLAKSVLQKCDFEISNIITSYVPNTSEISYCGLVKGLQEEIDEMKFNRIHQLLKNYSEKELKDTLRNNFKIEKILCKDAKIRTFIQEDRTRDNLVSLAYDITYDSVAPTDILVMVDDSIVRGTTLKNSIITNLDRLHPKRIVFVSSAPQIRYPDCYGIDISKISELVAFKAAISLLKERKMTHIITDVYRKCKRQQSSNLPLDAFQSNYVREIYKPFTAEDITNKIIELTRPEKCGTDIALIYQTIEGLHEAIPDRAGDWYFTGHYPTPGGVRSCANSFINWYEGRGNERGYGLVANALGSSILIIGCGGAEHFLASRISQSQKVGVVWVTPGNGGTDSTRLNGKLVKNVKINLDSSSELIQFCRVNEVACVIVNMQKLISDGLVDSLLNNNITVFGPSKPRGDLLSNTVSMKHFLKNCGVASNKFQMFTGSSQMDSAMEYLEYLWNELQVPISIRTSIVGPNNFTEPFTPRSLSDAKECISNHLLSEEDEPHPSVKKVLIEEKCEGRHISVCAFTDRTSFIHVPAVELFKKSIETEGGIKEYTVAAASPASLESSILQECFHQLKLIVEAFRNENFTNPCFITLSLVLTAEGPRATAVSNTFGNPESQTTLSLMQSDVYDLIAKCVENQLNTACVDLNDFSAISLVLCRDEHGTIQTADEVEREVVGVQSASKIPGVSIYQLQTKIRQVKEISVGHYVNKKELVTTGPLICTVVGVGKTFQIARSNASVAARSISSDGIDFIDQLCSTEQGGEVTGWSDVIDSTVHADSSAVATALNESYCSSDGNSSVPTTSNSTIESTGYQYGRNRSLTYLDVGVDRDAACVARMGLQELLMQEGYTGIQEKDGTYLYNLPNGKYIPKLIVSANCIGTKTKVAVAIGQYRDIGRDAVALSANNVIARGGRPMFFIDHFASTKLELPSLLEISKGVASACKELNCEVLMGEKAELPGVFMHKQDFSLCGFCAGILECDFEGQPTTLVGEGDVLLGLPSNGLHSNGFSLLRGALASNGLSYDAPAPWDTSKSLGEAFLTATKLYANAMLPLFEKQLIKRCANVTSGGLAGAVMSIIPAHLGVDIKCNAWDVQPVFRWLLTDGGIKWSEMVNTFNCGIGMIFIVSKSNEALVLQKLRAVGEEVCKLSELQRLDGRLSQLRFTNYSEIEQSIDMVDKSLSSFRAFSLSVNPFNMQRKVKVAVLVSHGGRLLQSLLDGSRDVIFPAAISLVVSNNDNAYALQRVRDRNIPTMVYSKKEAASKAHLVNGGMYQNTMEPVEPSDGTSDGTATNKSNTSSDQPLSFDMTLSDMLVNHKIQIVCMAGSGWELSDAFLEKWKNKVLDMQPSLTPSWDLRKRRTYDDVLNEGLRLTGCSAYLVNPSYCVPPISIVCQRSMEVEESDTVETLRQRSRMTCESSCYIEALGKISDGRMDVTNGRVKFIGLSASTQNM